jgi:glucuronoarabinoxylan endo-1,4-beta-xylanase
MAPALPARFVAIALLSLVQACGGSSGGSRAGAGGTGGAASDEVVADFSVALQHISGFGASSAWTLRDASDAFADQLFSADKGIGLSLLRVRISPSGTTDEVGTAQKAIARGASVWAAPWSPPGAWKSNGTDNHGGRLLPEHYGDWAERLTSFVADLKQQGVPLVQLSAQNEPNWVADWETCEWSETELSAFVRDELGPRLADLGLGTRVLAPETNDWSTVAKYGNALLNDRAAAGHVGAIATHAYGSRRPYAYTAPAEHGVELWETEVSDPERVADSGIDSALRVARMIHDHLTIAQVNAWHYWWLVPNGNNAADNSALTEAGELTRRAYALGNWSRFVRPGFVRVQATAAPRRGIAVTAFRDAENRRIVVVAINENTAAQTQSFTLSGSSVSQVTPWATSASLALASTEPLAVVDGHFSAELPARSISSFVGDTSTGETPPTGEGGAPVTP